MSVPLPVGLIMKAPIGAPPKGEDKGIKTTPASSSSLWLSSAAAEVPPSRTKTPPPVSKSSSPPPRTHTPPPPPPVLKAVALDLKKLHADDDTNSTVSTSMGSTGGLGKQPCTRCGVLWRWSKMHSWKQWSEEEDDWGDSEFTWQYRCAPCVKEVEGFESIQEAWDWIFANNGTAAKKKAKVDAFVKARTEMKESYDTMGVSKTKRELTQLTRVSLTQIFEGISDLIALKVASLESLKTTMERCSALREELKTCKDVHRIAAIVQIISTENEKDHQMLAFKDQNTGKTDWRKWMASTYHDEYVSTRFGYFRYWYICMAGHADWPCMTAITSKKWGRKYQDPGASKNKWKCTVCACNYWTKWGVFVEIRHKDSLYCLRSTIPDEDTLDIKAMEIERSFKEAKTAQDIYDAIPEIAPTVTNLVTCINEEKGQYRLTSKEVYDFLPVWNWAEILTFANRA